MPDTQKLRILFVLNPASGRNSKAEIEVAIRQYFKELPHEYECYQTTGNSDHTSVKHWVDSWQPDRVVAVGGDGTLKLVAEVLQGTDIPAGIIPAGSANGMARELGIPTAIKDSLDIIVNGVCRKIDLLRINDRHLCLHLSDIGMNAQLVKHFEENDLSGKMGYVRGAFRVMLKKRMMQVRITNEHTTVERDAFMVVLANARMYGTGAVINPEGDVSDGIFEIIIMRRLSFVEVLKMFLGGRNFNKDKIEILKATSVEIAVGKKAYFQVDGEYLGKTRAVTATIQKHALSIMQPA